MHLLWQQAQPTPSVLVHQHIPQYAYKRGWKEDPCKANEFPVKNFNDQPKTTDCRPKDFGYLTYSAPKCEDYLKEKGLSSKYLCDEPEFHVDGKLLCRFSSNTQAFFFVEQGSKSQPVAIPTSSIESKPRPTTNNMLLLNWMSGNFFCNKDELFWSPKPTPSADSDLWRLRGMACIVPKDLGAPTKPTVIEPPLKCDVSKSPSECYKVGDARYTPDELRPNFTLWHDMNNSPCPYAIGLFHKNGTLINHTANLFHTISLLLPDRKTYKTEHMNFETRLVWSPEKKLWKFLRYSRIGAAKEIFFLGANCAYPSPPSTPAAQCRTPPPAANFNITPADAAAKYRIEGTPRVDATPVCSSGFIGKNTWSYNATLVEIVPTDGYELFCRAGEYFLVYKRNSPFIVDYLSCYAPK